MQPARFICPGNSLGKNTGVGCRRILDCLSDQAIKETWVQPLGREDPLEEAMATHSSVLACRIPWTEEPGGLQSVGSQSQTPLSD